MHKPSRIRNESDSQMSAESKPLEIESPKPLGMEHSKPLEIEPPRGRKQSEDAPMRQWHVCCSQTDPEFIKYVSQLLVSAAVMGLAITKLAQGSEDALYPSLLTMILGVYVPTPTHRST